LDIIKNISVKNSSKGNDIENIHKNSSKGNVIGNINKNSSVVNGRP